MANVFIISILFLAFKSVLSLAFALRYYSFLVVSLISECLNTSDLNTLGISTDFHSFMTSCWMFLSFSFRKGRIFPFMKAKFHSAVIAIPFYNRVYTLEVLVIFCKESKSYRYVYPYYTSSSHREWTIKF